MMINAAMPAVTPNTGYTGTAAATDIANGTAGDFNGTLSNMMNAKEMTNPDVAAVQTEIDTQAVLAAENGRQEVILTEQIDLLHKELMLKNAGYAQSELVAMLLSDSNSELSQLMDFGNVVEETAAVGTVTADMQTVAEKGFIPADTQMVAEMGSVPADTQMVAERGSVPADTQMVAEMGSVPADTQMVTENGSVPADTQMVTEKESVPTDTQAVTEMGSVPADTQAVTEKGFVPADTQAVTEKGFVSADTQAVAEKEFVSADTQVVTEKTTDSQMQTVKMSAEPVQVQTESVSVPMEYQISAEAEITMETENNSEPIEISEVTVSENEKPQTDLNTASVAVESNAEKQKITTASQVQATQSNEADIASVKDEASVKISEEHISEQTQMILTAEETQVADNRQMVHKPQVSEEAKVTEGSTESAEEAVEETVGFERSFAQAGRRISEKSEEALQLAKSISRTKSDSDLETEKKVTVKQELADGGIMKNDVQFERTGALDRENNAPVKMTVNEAYQLISERATSATGKQTFTVVLTPETLGKITVKMTSESGKLSVEILTETEAAKQLFESRANELAENLKQSNVEIESYRVETENDQLFNESFDGSSKNPYARQQQNEAPEDDDEFERLISEMMGM